MMDHEYTDEDILSLTKIQAIYKRYYVQNEMKKLRKEYEEIFYEIEGTDTDTKVLWPNEKAICYPTFVSSKAKTNATSTPVAFFTKKSTKKDEDTTTAAVTTTTITKLLESDESTAKVSNRHVEAVLTATKNDTENNKINDETTSVNIIKFDVDEKQLDYLKHENLVKLGNNDLIELKENVSLEILWIQQAIQSRIQYLNLKKTIEDKKRYTSPK